MTGQASGSLPSAGRLERSPAGRAAEGLPGSALFVAGAEELPVLTGWSCDGYSCSLNKTAAHL